MASALFCRAGAWQKANSAIWPGYRPARKNDAWIRLAFQLLQNAVYD
jgi:hypothetical protein